VSRAKTDSPEGRRALAELCNAYYEPVTTFLRCELRDADTARELAHDFFARSIIGRPFRASVCCYAGSQIWFGLTGAEMAAVVLREVNSFTRLMDDPFQALVWNQP